MTQKDEKKEVIVQISWLKGLLKHARKTHKLVKQRKAYKIASDLELSGFIGYAESAKFIIKIK